MSYLERCACVAAIIGLGLATTGGAHGQVTSINAATTSLREFNDIPTSTLTAVNTYPTLISFNDQNVSAATGFANRHVWRFSNNGGIAPYPFMNDDFFSVSMELTLTGSPIAPRKEAGFLFDTLGGQGQFIVNTDAHEIVAFGGPLPFYAFPSTYNSGDTITLGMTYFLDPNNQRAIIYSANGVQSPPQVFTNLEQGIIDGTKLGGYLQVVNDPTNATNSGSAVFGNISIVPEPSGLAILGLGVLSLTLRSRRRRM